MKENLYYSELYDLYGELLSQKQQLYFSDYYFENLLVEEIAENYLVSKNAVSKQLKSAKQNLEYYESKLALQKKAKLIENEFKNEKDILKRIHKYDNIKLTKEEGK